MASEPKSATGVRPRRVTVGEFVKVYRLYHLKVSDWWRSAADWFDPATNFEFFLTPLGAGARLWLGSHRMAFVGACLCQSLMFRDLAPALAVRETFCRAEPPSKMRERCRCCVPILFQYQH